MNELDRKIKMLNQKTHEFKFKILRPWLVLGPGDVVNAEAIMNRCEARAESVKNGEKQADLDKQQNDSQLKQLCSIESLGNLYHKRLEPVSEAEISDTDDVNEDDQLIIVTLDRGDLANILIKTGMQLI